MADFIISSYVGSKIIVFTKGDSIISSYVGSKIIVFTKGDSIISNDASIVNCNVINCCTSEEADPRLVRHMIHCVDTGYQNVVVYTGDTDVLVLLTSFRPMTKMYSNVYAYCGYLETLHRIFIYFAE